MKFSKIEGVCEWSGGTILLKRGMSIDDDHPLAQERADLFDDQEPKADIQSGGPVVERATAAPGEIRTTPGAGPAKGNRVPARGSGQ
jgi:hypothetical protein